MAKFGCPAKFIAMLRQFHAGMLAKKKVQNEFSDPFQVTNGVEQGFVLATNFNTVQHDLFCHAYICFLGW